jgi:hypothetical protein
MTKQDWIVRVYKTDKRCKSGERFVAKYPFSGMARDTVQRELNDLAQVLYPKKNGWRFDVQPATMIVKNLMTGKDVEIASDTPWCCNPASESYWSM